MATSYVEGRNVAATVHVWGQLKGVQTIKVPQGAKLYTTGDTVEIQAANGDTVAFFSVANILGVVIEERQ